MPRISLIVCLRGERDLLARLLEHAEGCYDDLVVVHDGPEDCFTSAPTGDAASEKEAGWKSPEELSLTTPDAPPKEIARDYAQLAPESPLPTGYRLVRGPTVPGSIHELVARHGGRFYEGPRCLQQEPHWPLAWWAAKHRWILKLDSDEFLSEELKQWLIHFRADPEPVPQVIGYTSIWPHWDGRRAVGNKWPDGRTLLFNKNQVRMIGLVEMTPQGSGEWAALPLVLHHIPTRKSYGFRNILWRRQAWVWRSVIAQSILKSPLLLPRWNWEADSWPQPFRVMAERPWFHLYRSIFVSWRWGLKSILKNRLWSVLYCFFAAGWHHALICLNVIVLRAIRKKHP